MQGGAVIHLFLDIIICTLDGVEAHCPIHRSVSSRGRLCFKQRCTVLVVLVDAHAAAPELGALTGMSFSTEDSGVDTKLLRASSTLHSSGLGMRSAAVGAAGCGRGFHCSPT